MKKYLTSFLIAFTAVLRMAHADQPGSSSSGMTPTPALPGDPLPTGQFPVGYPYPATIKPSTGWDVYATGNFLWWKPYALTALYAQETTTDGAVSRILYFKNNYHPGFKVALGANLGPVLGEVQYTRFHYTGTTHHSAESGHVLTPAVLAAFILPFGPTANPQPNVPTNLGAYRHIKGHMKFDYDTLKVSAIKPVYLGRKLTLNAQYGLIGGWETHVLNIECRDAILDGSNGFANGQHKYWMIGPFAGLKAKALLPWGFRAIGKMELALCYLKYTESHFKDSFPLLNAFAFPLVIGSYANQTTKYKEPIDAWKPQMDAGLGLGWDSYLAGDKLHLDISVSYDFITQSYSTPTTLTEAFLDDTNLHGFNVQCQLDF